MRKFLIPLMAVLLTAGLAMTSCKKDDDTKDIGKAVADSLNLLPAKPTVGTVTETSASVSCGMNKKSGEITELDIALAKSLNMECGFVLAEGEKEPETSDTKIDCTDGAIASQGKTMTAEFSNLKEGTKYSVRAYAKYYGKTFYGATTTFTTGKTEVIKPEIAVTDISKIYLDGCMPSGKISNWDKIDKNLVQEIGFCIAAQGKEPTVENVKGTVEKAASTFTVIIHNEAISEGTWTIRAYVKYNDEIIYSEAKDFDIVKVDLKITLTAPSEAKGEIYTNGCKLNAQVEDYDALTQNGIFGTMGFCYALKGTTPTVDDKTITAHINRAKGSFYEDIKDADIKHKEITIRAYVDYNSGIYYSDPIDVQTIAFQSEITLNAPTRTFYNGCEISATISDFDKLDSKTIEETGFCICPAGSDPETSDIAIKVSPTSKGVLAEALHSDDITAGKWAIRAYVKFDGETFYSNTKEFEIEKIDYGFDEADKKFHYGTHKYEITEDFDPNNYDPVNVYDGKYYNYVKFSNIPSDYLEFETVYKEFLGKHINGIIALQIMALEVYNRDREDGVKCFMLINQASDKNTILERVGHRYDNVNPDENQPYLAATFLQGAHRTNLFKPTKEDGLYSIKFQADPDGKKSTSLTGRGDVFYVDVIAEGWDSQKVKRCQVVLWEKMVIKGGYYEMHEWSSFVLTAPSIYGEDNSLWEGLD